MECNGRNTTDAIQRMEYHGWNITKNETKTARWNTPDEIRRTKYDGWNITVGISQKMSQKITHKPECNGRSTTDEIRRMEYTETCDFAGFTFQEGITTDRL